jgi:parallel beta-helix repeat protein
MKKMMLLAACLAAVLLLSLLVPPHTTGMQKDGHPCGTSDDLVFIHHSCGQNWLSDGLHSALLAKTYVDERNDIYYGTDIPPDTGRPDSLAPAPGDRTDMDHWIRWFNDYLGGVHTHGCADGVNHIIMFKSCYPISNIVANGTEPGDPFDGTQTIANYKAVYRHPNGTGHTYTHGGYTYQPLEDIFAAHPDILFIPVTAPPRHYAPSDATNDAQAHRARVFNTWLKQDWLTGYNTAHPDHDNVAVFDWFDLLAYPDNHSSHPNRLRAAYGGESGNSHPNTAANQNSTQAFATNPGSFIDTAWNAFNASDSTPPAITDITASPDPQDEGSPVNISCTVTDPDGVQDVYLHVTGPGGYDRNMSITGNVTGSTYYCNTTYPYPGNYTYAIWANDTLGYSNSSTGHGFTITTNTYYVATSGSDSDPGTITQPWATIQHALDTATVGDTIMVRGGTYNEYLGTNTSGIPGHPITLQGYPGETVVLNGSGLNWRYGIDIGGADHLVIQNLTITDYIRNGLRGFGFVSWYGSTNITLRNLEFSLVGTPVKFNRGGTGIHLENITAHTYDSAGFDCGPNGPGINISLCNVTFFGPGNGTNTAVDGFAVEYGSNVTMEDCTAIGHPGDGFDFKSDNTTLRRCIARNNSRNNIKLWGDNSSLINCLSSNSGLVNLVLETGGSYTITNCLFASRDSYGYLAEMGYNAGATTPITVYNTIFYNDDPDMAGTTLYLGGNVSLTANHNLYYNPYRENDVIDAAFLGRTFSNHDINDGTWHNLSGCGHNSSYANPLFTNASTDDYHLAAGSPAVDAGTSIMAPSVDLDHRSRPQGAAYDIGPYERLAGAPSIVYVDDDYNATTPGWQTDHFDVIQDGIGAVAVNGTVHVANGTYYENVAVNKTIDLTGEHRDGTVVDGGGNGDVVTITADGVNISGFIIRYGGQEGIYLDRAHNCSIKNVEAYGNGDVGVLVERGRNNLIANCRMHNNSYDGVLLEYANYTFVTGITCSWNGIGNNGEGILLLHSRFCVIANNTCHANGESGIIAEPSSCNNTIANNTCSGNADAGIVVSTNSNDNIIAHNILYNNTYDGLLVETSSGTNITANTIFHNGEDGVYLLSANTTLVHANTIYNNTRHGIYLDASSRICITNNSVHHHIGDVLGDDIGKGICLYCSDDNILENNVVNFNDEVGINLIDSSNNTLCANTADNNYDDGIFLYISSYNTLVNNSACNNSGEAVYGSDGIVLYGTTLVFSKNNTVEHNTVKDNDAHGLQLRYASNNSLNHNMVCNNGWGGVSIWTNSHNNTLAWTCLRHNNGSSIYLGESSYNLLMNNAINGSEYGIYLDTSPYNTIADSTVVNADLIGINIANSSYNLIKNTTSENNSYGIYFYAASGWNEVAHTIIAGNTDSGVYLGPQADHNLLYNNYFNNSCNAWDAGNNTWNITKTPGTNIIGGSYLGGNYWSDYDGADTDGDGLGDTNLPYNASGNIENGGDWNPLLSQNMPPVAGFTIEPVDPSPMDTIFFNSTSMDIDGGIVNWTWQMGDGTILYGEQVTHSYADTGIYMVELTVMDEDGATDVMTRQVVVVSIDRIAIVFESENEIADGNLSTNCSFSCHAAAFNSTYGFVEFVDASWSLSTTNATASINTTQGRSVMFSSGDTDGTAVLTADAGNGHVDAVSWIIDDGLYTAYLSHGWNLVTVAVANTYTAASLGQNLSGCSIVARWNASAGMFQSFVVGVSPGDGFALEDGVGYFIYMDSSGLLSDIDVPIAHVSVDLYQGWNTLGWYNDTATNASSLGSAVGNCSIVACWNTSSSTFESYLVGVSPPSVAFRIERGMGVFVYVTKPGVWHGGG